MDDCKTENDINHVIDELSSGDRLTVAQLNILGTSSFKILERIHRADQKNISIYLVYENLLISRENKVLFSLIDSLFKIDKFSQNQRLMAAKTTRNKNGTKLGRKSGKKTKSMFDKYKSKIIKLHNQGVPKTKILAEIKKDNQELKDSSPQALGQYIKKIESKKTKNNLTIPRFLPKDMTKISF